jgi:hypothetical protein
MSHITSRRPQAVDVVITPVHGDRQMSATSETKAEPSVPGAEIEHAQGS